jgi:hypothetical protein
MPDAQLTDAERHRFVDYLRLEAANEKELVKQLAKAAGPVTTGIVESGVLSVMPEAIRRRMMEIIAMELVANMLDETESVVVES